MQINNKENYIQFVEKNKKNLPIYFHTEWLNAVCGESWFGLVYKNKAGLVEAIMPLPFKKVFNKLIFSMPKQTQFLGIWFGFNFELTNFKRYAKEQAIINYFISIMPSFLIFKIRFSPSFINHQPFYWKGFKQTNQYSYVLEDIKNHELLFNTFKGSVRSDIRKAGKILKIVESENVEEFYNINKLSFERQNIKIKYSFNLVCRIDDYLKGINQRKILLAKDENDEIHAVLYLIWDKQKAYYLWGGANPKLRNSNAQSYLLWAAIKEASKHVNVFDFEGSMIENIATVFKKFNAKAVPYYRIYKANNYFLKMREY